MGDDDLQKTRSALNGQNCPDDEAVCSDAKHRCYALQFLSLFPKTALNGQQLSTF